MLETELDPHRNTILVMLNATGAQLFVHDGQPGDSIRSCKGIERHST